MNRLALLIVSAALLVAAPTAAAQLPAAGFSSDNVEILKSFGTHADSSGARLKDGFFYITTERDLSIYDVKDPENPVKVGGLTFETPGTPVFSEEDVDTNGKVLLRWDDGIEVFDVTDKTAPTRIGHGDGGDEHTVTCILDCTWAYGSGGQIADLRDPKNPKVVGDWTESSEVTQTHDVTEVSPGIILTSSTPMVLLDARQDPAKPKVITSTATPGYTHANLWPHAGGDDFALVGGEAQGTPDCSESESATFQTWDARGGLTGKPFTLLDQFAMSTGVPTDGKNPYATYCVHWFDDHPTYRNGGLVAIAWYEHGTRFLKIGTDGQIEEIGYMIPYAGQTSGVYWITDRILYTADYTRGMDILKFTGDIPQGRANPTAPNTPLTPGGGNGGGDPKAGRAASFDSFVKLPSARRCVRRLKIRARKGKDPVTRLTVRVDGRKKALAKGTKKSRRGVTLRKLPRKKRFTVQVEVRTRSGHRTAAQRTYRGC